MKSFGTILKEAREAKGLTCSQVAHDTHMLVQIVEDMEREDFHRIPAPIYGRGFVRLYAERVGLDPAPLITEFMEIFEGHRTPRPQPPITPPPPPAVPDRQPDLPLAPKSDDAPPPAAFVPPAEPTPSEPPAPAETPQATEQTAEQPAEEQPVDEQPAEQPAPAEPPPPVEVPPALRGLDLFDPNARETPAVVPPPSALPQNQKWESPFASAYTDPPGETDQKNAAERFKESISVVSHGVLGRVRQIPRRAWRITLLSLVAIGIVILVLWGCRALYKATEPQKDVSAATQPPAAVQTASNAKPTQKPPQKPSASAKDKTAKDGAKAKTSTVKPASLKSTGPSIEPLYID